MNTADNRLGLSPARAICVCVPSPQSKSSHSASRATASPLTFLFRVGLPELVPSGITLIGVYNTIPNRIVQIVPRFKKLRFADRRLAERR